MFGVLLVWLEPATMPPNHLASGGRGRGGDSLGYLAWGSMIQNRGKKSGFVQSPPTGD